MTVAFRKICLGVFVTFVCAFLFAAVAQEDEVAEEAYSEDTELELPIADGLGVVIPVPTREVRSISAAMMNARPGDTVRVANGTYRERNIYIAPGVVLQAENLFGAVLDGRGRGTIVSMGNGSTIMGFEIRNGTIGIYSNAAQAVIRNCRITKHTQSGIVSIGTLPVIEDNLIVFNKGSGVQGWDVRTTSGSINHNTIAFNGNHGLSLGGNTSITVENNIIAFNGQFGIQPVGETVRVELINNNLYLNARMSLNLPAENFASDPLFTDARRNDFTLMSGSHSIGQGPNNQNLGSRILQ